MNALAPHALSFGLDNRMTVVLFAGMGGGCDGLEDAGYHVHLAVNHDPIAIAVHEKRHPHTKHLRCDVFEVDPHQATQGRGVRVLHASPDCTHFSVAKGSKPVSKRRRSLAWVIPRWLGQADVEVVTLENVREIQTWGPLVAKRDPKTGRVMKLDKTVAAKGEVVPLREQWLVPDPRKGRKGRIWKAFVRHIEGLGYDFEWRELNCADYGIPTIRKRLFGVMKRRGSGPIEWPERTHAPRAKAKALGLKPWVGAHTIINWSLPVKSIFGRKKPLAEATLRRIARGVMRYVINAKQPFIVPITHTQGSNQARSVDEPLNTLTTAKGGELMLVVPTIVDTAHGEGQGRGVSEWPVDEPLRTVSASPGKGIAMAHLTQFRTGATGVDLNEPMPTYTANSFHKRPGGAPPMGIVAAHLEKFSENSVGQMPDEPLKTIMAGGQGQAVVAATLVASGYGERAGQAPRVLDLGEPIPTQVAGGSKAALVAAFLAQHNNDSRREGGVNPGRDARDPLSTITVAAAQQGVVAAALGRLRGSDVDGQAIDHPLPTQTCGGSHEMLILPFLQTYYGSGDNNHDPLDPLHTITVNDRHGLVTVEVDGQTMVMTDICMRMLDPLEGAAAHGFDPASFDHLITVTDAKGRQKVRKPTKTEIGHLVGNSVPKRMVQLLAQHNVEPELMVAAE
jgi:DNA (cytosine-5)-methyltransferase 1